MVTSLRSSLYLCGEENIHVVDVLGSSVRAAGHDEDPAAHRQAGAQLAAHLQRKA